MGEQRNSPGPGWAAIDSEPKGSASRDDVTPAVHVAEVCRGVRYPCLFCGRLCVTSEPSFTTYHQAVVQFKEPEAGTLRTVHVTIGAWVLGRWECAIRSLVAKTVSHNSAESLEPRGCLYKSRGYSSWLACQGRLTPPAREPGVQRQVAMAA